MTIVFFSNVLNHHQVALCDEIYRQNNGNFYFVETGSLNMARRSMGFNQYERDYVIRTVEEKDSLEKARQLAILADVAIMGAESYDFLRIRIKNSNGVTFSYSERWLKQGIKNILSPNLLKLIKLYITIGHKRRWFMLAASGFLANDLKRLGIFKNKVYKWGYFPMYPKVDLAKKFGNNPVKLLWVARFIVWKRPDMMIELAGLLLDNGYDFELTMIGDGPMHNSIKSKIDGNPKIAERVRLLGNIPNENVLKEMASSDIYCFTSTRREGWGAVLGEAMASGCCPVSSSDAGATPFLIHNGKNGLIFTTDDVKDLYEKVTFLIANPDQRMKMAKNAHIMMLDDWSATTAAQQFIILAKTKLCGINANLPDNGLPASVATPLNY